MQAGSLSQCFAGVGVKTVTGTEVNPTIFRGHQCQGVDSFRAFLGTPAEKTRVPVMFVAICPPKQSYRELGAIIVAIKFLG